MSFSKYFKFVTEGPVYLQSSLKAFELNDSILNDKYGLNVRSIDYNDTIELDKWCSIIHDSYDDCYFTTESAKSYLNEHDFLTDTKTFIFSNKNGEDCATVSIGVYKNAPHIGGDFRIGVRNKHQGRGIGKLCILYAYSKLAASGIKHGESVISIKRKESLHLHFSLGFRPQYRSKYLAKKSTSKQISFRQKVVEIFKHYFFIPDLLRKAYLRFQLYKSYKLFLKQERDAYL